MEKEVLRTAISMIVDQLVNKATDEQFNNIYPIVSELKSAIYIHAKITLEED